ncbi:MAG: NAD(P)-dependent oxidoreductase [Cyanobacteria bacterium]|nr:NAD(P)-dependent oxidoreductase [Cyanobacteriota bacterium]
MSVVPETTQTEVIFPKIKPPLHQNQAVIEASRCLFCHDAPCIQACPTSIDIPMFIRQIMTHNTAGAAKTIFTQNIMGRACAYVCPTEVLCEGACVYNDLNEKPIDIGRLQGFATDAAIANNWQFFEANDQTETPLNKKVAIIGGGPSGLACAHELTRLGVKAVVFEASEHAGGLNTYGVAPYKYGNNDSIAEVAYLQQIGFEIQTHTRVISQDSPQDKSFSGKTISIEALDAEYDAIFIGAGLGKSKRLGLPGEHFQNIHGAAEFIYTVRKLGPANVSIGQKVLVIGAGNTAIDASVQSAKLGAEVMLVYRRTQQDQSAYYFEVELARLNGVQFKYQASPVEVLGTSEGLVSGVRFVKNQLGAPDSLGKQSMEPVAGSEFDLPCDTVIFATGQEKLVEFYRNIAHLELENGKIKVNDCYQTHNPKYFAGGDCVNGGKEVVNAVAHGRDAARGIAQYLKSSISARTVSHV